jgi:hypothetical protein
MINPMVTVTFDDEVWPEYDEVLACGEAFEDALENMLDSLAEHGPKGMRTGNFDNNTYLATAGVIGAADAVFIVFEWKPADALVIIRGVGHEALPPRPRPRR